MTTSAFKASRVGSIMTTPQSSYYRAQSILYEQFGAPALIYRDVSTWTTATEKHPYEMFGNCLQIINCCGAGGGEPSQYYTVRPCGLHRHEICLSKIVFPNDNTKKDLQRLSKQGKNYDDTANNSINLHAPIQQIVSYGAPDIRETSGNTWFMARTRSHCSVICVSHKMCEQEKDEEQIVGRKENAEREILQEVTRIYFDNDELSSSFTQPETILKVCNDKPRYCTGYHNVSSSCFFSPPPMFAIAGPKNTIHQLVVGSSPSIQSYTFENICNQKMIEYTFHPMILWSSAYHSNTNDFGNILFQLDLRSKNSATRVWSASHANYMVDGMCSIRSFLQHPTKEHTAYATSSLGKLYELDTRMPMKQVVTWTLPAEVETYRNGDDLLVMATAAADCSSNLTDSHHKNDDEVHQKGLFNITQSSSPALEAAIIAVQKAPLAYGLRLYQSPTQSPCFGTLPLESGPYSGISTKRGHSCIATSAVYPLPDFSPNVFYCGLASVSIPKLLLQRSNGSFSSSNSQRLYEDRKTSQSQTQHSALCVLLLTSLGDMYCHTLLECDRNKPRQSFAFDGLPLGVSAIPVPQPSSSFSIDINDTHFLPIYLTNKYPLPSSAILPCVSEADDIDFYNTYPIPTNSTVHEKADQDGILPATKGLESDDRKSSSCEEETVNDLNSTRKVTPQSIGQLLLDHPLAHWEIQRYSGCSEFDNVATMIKDASIILGETEEQIYFGMGATEVSDDGTTERTNYFVELKQAIGGIVPATIETRATISGEDNEALLDGATNISRYCVPSTIAGASYLASKKYQLPTLDSKRSDLSKEKIMKLDEMWDE